MIRWRSEVADKDAEGRNRPEGEAREPDGKSRRGAEAPAAGARTALAETAAEARASLARTAPAVTAAEARASLARTALAETAAEARASSARTAP
ncbi:hypothetical protein MO973_42755, partial [Paenibacillus sp. TRM 82003]|nr:hypothetical protein [Paenibacillus sp. TRM 82003]